MIKPYTTKSNSLLIEEYNALTTTLQNKLRDYQFSSLEDVNKSIDNYKQGSERLLLQLKEGEATIVKQSNSLLNLKLTGLCNENGICDTQTNFKKTESTKNVQEVCNMMQSTKQEVSIFNEKVSASYKLMPFGQLR